MDFHFDPTFALLAKFGIGLRPVPTSEEEVKAVSKYLGIDLPVDELETNARRLSKELERQNEFLAENLELDSIYESDDYRKSNFVRDIVGNNRRWRERRQTAKR